MKRGAEHQLSKGDDSDELDVDIQEAPTFKKADESVLATRKIRALPKRSLAGTTNGASVSSSEAPSVPKFGGFAGFGTPVSKSDSFTFTSANPTSSSSNQSPPSPSPFVSTSASAATKTFASFLDSSAPSSVPPPAMDTSVTKESDAGALKYYTSLRGLNVSFLSAVSAALDQDPFSDVSNLLDRYRDLRITVQKEFDEKTTQTKDKAGSNNVLAAVSSPSDKPPAASPPSSSMPVPPTGFAGFGAISSSASSSSTALGFVPKTDNSTPTKTSAFSFPSMSAPSAIPPPIKALDFALPPQVSSATSPPPAPVNAAFNFTLPSSTSKFFDPTEGKGTLFGAPSTSSSTFSLFGPSPLSNAGSPFVGFGSPNPTPKDKGSSADPASTPTPFGTSSKSDATSPSLFGSSFGSNTTIKSPFGGFGKPSSSIGNPVGFAFGMAPKTSAGDTAPAIAPASAFSFGPPPTQKSSAATTPEVGDTDGTTTPVEDEEGNKLFQKKTHDLEGEGEEDEETKHAVRTKVFKLSKAKGESSWVEMGVGVLRLKKHKEKDSRRVLLRNSNTGKITINFSIYAELNPTQTGKFVSFVGHEDGTPIMFKLRLKSEEDSVELKRALDREIALVKANSDE